MRLELCVGEPASKQIERLENRQSGADQCHELLIENQKFFQIETLAAAGNVDVPGKAQSGAIGFDRINEKTLARIPFPNLLSRSSLRYLAMNFAASIGVLQ